MYSIFISGVDKNELLYSYFTENSCVYECAIHTVRYLMMPKAGSLGHFVSTVTELRAPWALKHAPNLHLVTFLCSDFRFSVEASKKCRVGLLLICILEPSLENLNRV